MVAYNALRKPKICHHAARRSVRTCHAHLGSSCTTRCFQPQTHAERNVQREQEHNSHPGSTAGHEHVLRTEAPRACDQLHDKPASGFSRGVDKSADVQQKRRHQEPSHSKLLHVRVMRSLSLRNLIREGSWISCPATPDALSSEAFSGLAPETDPCRHLHNWSAFWLRVQSPVRPNPYAPGTWLRTEASNERV